MVGILEATYVHMLLPRIATPAVVALDSSCWVSKSLTTDADSVPSLAIAVIRSLGDVVEHSDEAQIRGFVSSRHLGYKPPCAWSARGVCSFAVGLLRVCARRKSIL